MNKVSLSAFSSCIHPKSIRYSVKKEGGKEIMQRKEQGSSKEGKGKELRTEEMKEI